MSDEETKDTQVKSTEEPAKRRSIIDLSLGLEAVSPVVKVKRGSIDLSLGLEHAKNEQSVKPPVPPSILKYGLERQVSNETNGSDEVSADLSPELLSLLQSNGESGEAWEVKADVDHKVVHSDEVVDAADILSKLGFTEDLNVESETWETKKPQQETNTSHGHNDDEGDDDHTTLDESKVLGLLGITGDQDAGEAWEKKTTTTAATSNNDDLII